MAVDIARDLAAVAQIEAVPTILRTIRESTGLRFTLIARVLPDRWVACAVHDEINFGLGAGGELDVTRHSAAKCATPRSRWSSITPIETSVTRTIPRRKCTAFRVTSRFRSFSKTGSTSETCAASIRCRASSATPRRCGAPRTPVRVAVAGTEKSFEVRVENEGAQIPEETRARLFQPYFRGGQTSRANGLGLGLYIVSEIAKSHQGRVDVTSTAERTAFTFAIPR